MSEEEYGAAAAELEETLEEAQPALVLYLCIIQYLIILCIILHAYVFNIHYFHSYVFIFQEAAAAALSNLTKADINEVCFRALKQILNHITIHIYIT